MQWHEPDPGSETPQVDQRPLGRVPVGVLAGDCADPSETAAAAVTDLPMIELLIVLNLDHYIAPIYYK
jgi:hypothetical protein